MKISLTTLTLDNLMITRNKDVIINETFDKKIHEYHKYTYNDNNERILKQSPKKPGNSPSETYYVYDGNGNVLTEYEDNEFAANYVFANGRRALRLHGDGSHDYYHTNYLGSSILITSDLKSVWSRSFYPFGGEMEASGDGNKYGFTGKEYDRETSFGYHWNRYYDKDLGRFRSVDPLWHKYPTLSSYQYCDNNPMVIVDKDGKQTAQIALLGTAGAGTGVTTGGGLAFGIDGMKPFSQAGGGSFVGMSAGAALELTLSLNKSTDKLNGTVMSNGGSIKLGPVNVGIEINTPIDGSDAKGSLTIIVGLSTPPVSGVSGEVHSFIQKTTIKDLKSTTIIVDLGDQTSTAPADATNTTLVITPESEDELKNIFNRDKNQNDGGENGN